MFTSRKLSAVRSLLLSVLCLAVSAGMATAQDLSGYRGFRLGMTVAAAAQRAGLPVTAARSLHQRPQLIQEFDWQPPTQAGGADPEAVRTVSFAFRF
jgi:hypothetical protein